MQLYELSVKDMNGNDVSLKEFQGKVLLIVNTATACGFTPQYSGLQSLFNGFKDQGFEVLDFPCNQFGSQAPGSNSEIDNFCTTNYNTTFRRFAKIDVNGKNESKLYTFLKDKQKGVLGTKNIKWNFTKFLVDKTGNVVKRYSPDTKPDAIRSDIEVLLK
ncbi:MAG: glutathione peroxidase [Leptonema sp. (in: Bacteria)]|nr:glutathione peroxidase [Leptonema sp. (in: bacteria)]